MASNYQIYADQFLTFTLVLVRVSMLVTIAPIYGTSEVPARIRALLAVVLALLIVPMELEKHVDQPDNIAGYAVLVGAEALIGLSLGLGTLILFSGMHVAGQIISQMSGMQLAEVVSPGFDNSVPVFSQLLYYVAMAVFVVIGGHRQVMAALLDTFTWLPAGDGGFSQSMVEATTALLTQSFILGVRAAAPAMIALLLATLILGLVSRTLPQLNVMAMGFGFNAIATLISIGVSLGVGAWIFQEQLVPYLETILQALRPTTAGV